MAEIADVVHSCGPRQRSPTGIAEGGFIADVVDTCRSHQRPLTDCASSKRWQEKCAHPKLIPNHGTLELI